MCEQAITIALKDIPRPIIMEKVKAKLELLLFGMSALLISPEAAYINI